jgi:hypothetical protein
VRPARDVTERVKECECTNSQIPYDWRGIVEIHLDEQHTVGFFVGETYDRGSVIEVNGFVLTSAEHED